MKELYVYFPISGIVRTGIALIFALSLTSLNNLFAQNLFPPEKNSSVRIDGGGITYVRPAVTGGWARGINFYNAGVTERTLALGMLGNGDQAQRFYIAYGHESPWNSLLGLHLLPSGNVGIGTTTPQERLSVNGNIRAKEVKVEMANWPDYVFKEGYNLMPLAELETHIRTHGHLPGIPTAEEAEADGIGLAEMNRKLLEKVEELTLHLIGQENRLVEKNKTIAEYGKRIDIQDARINDLSQRLEQLASFTEHQTKTNTK